MSFNYRFFSGVFFKTMSLSMVILAMTMLHLGATDYSQDLKVSIHADNITLEQLFAEIGRQTGVRFLYRYKSIAKITVNINVTDMPLSDLLSQTLADKGLKHIVMDNNQIVIASARSKQEQGIVVTGIVTDDNGNPLPNVGINIKGTPTGVVSDDNGKFSVTVIDGKAVLIFSYIGYATKKITVGSQKYFAVTLDESFTEIDEVVVVAYGTAKKRDLTGAVSAVDTKLVAAQSNSSVSRALEGAVAGLQVSAVEGQPGLDMKIRVRGLGSTLETSSYALVVIDGVPAQIDNALAIINPNDIASITVLKDAASTALYGSRGANGVILVTTKKGLSGKARITFGARWGVNAMTNNMPDLVRDPAKIYEHMWLLNYNTYRYSDGKLYQNNGFTNSAPTGGEHTHDEAALFASQHLFNYTGNSAALTRNDLGNWMLYEFPGWDDPTNYAITGNPGDATQSSTMLKNFLVGVNGKLNPAAKLRYNDSFYNQLLQPRFRQEYNLAAGGGNDKMDYHVSMGYLSDPSYLSISKFDRYTGRAVVNGKVTDWAKVGANISYSYRTISGQTTRDNADTGLRQGMGDVQENIFSVVNGEIPLVQLYARDRRGNYILNADGSRKVTTANGDSYSPLGPTAPGVGTGGDIIYRMANDKAEIASHDLTARTYIETKFLNGFSFTANIATDATFSEALNYRNAAEGRAANIGALNRQTGIYVTLNTQQLLNWNRDFGKHHIDALVGHEYNQYSTSIMRFTSTHELIPGYTGYVNFTGRYTGSMIASTAIRYPQPGGDLSKLTMEGYFAHANYIYDYKYYFSASLRRDGSSKFKYDEDRWGTFWSLGGGWRITGEPFMQSASNWLNNLKLRASYGVIGNQNGIGAYGGYQLWSYSAVYRPASNGTGIPSSYIVSPSSFVNERLTWENVHTVDVGLEFDLFNRVHGSFEWYNRETVNAFYANTLSIAAEAFAGATSIMMDNAKIRNRGFEIDINIDIIRSKNFYWSIGMTGSHYNTILTKLPTGQGSELYNGNKLDNTEYLCYLRGEGKPYYNTFMYKYEGPDPKTGVPLYRHVVSALDHEGDSQGNRYFTEYPVGTVIKTANYTRVVPTDRIEFGDALPDWIGGFSTTFSYRNFDLNAVLSYQIGGLYHHREMVYFYETDFGRDGPRPIASDLIGNTWTPDNPSAKFPIAVHNKGTAGAYGLAVGNGPQQTTDLTLFGASYLCLKNITLGYSLPQAWANRIGFRNLRVYLSADNLYMLSEYRGVDPRMSLTGGNDVVSFTYPYLRVFNVGINIEF
jgi:TonB-linked SusC/RagA family outer membrane protein